MVIKIRLLVTQRELKIKGQEKLSIIIKVIFLLIENVIPQVNKCAKTHQIIFLKSAHFTLCKLYLSKMIFKNL